MKIKPSAALALCFSLLAVQAHAQSCKQILSTADRALALNQIANLMGRYAHLNLLRGESTQEELFAMQTAGVFWKTATGPVGIEAMKKRFLQSGEQAPPLKPGLMFVHAMLTPIIEIAADGKTAQGVWDSFGPLVSNADAVGDWLWVKYGVDFVKENGQWKIWHLQVFPIFNTPYNKSITQSAKERMVGGAQRPGGPPPNGASQNISGPKDPLWIYDGKSAARGPYVPEPYCTYDEAKSSAQYASDAAITADKK